MSFLKLCLLCVIGFMMKTELEKHAFMLFFNIGLIVASAAVYYYLHQSLHISSVLQTCPGVRANRKFKTSGDIGSSDLEGLCVIYQYVAI